MIKHWHFAPAYRARFVLSISCLTLVWHNFASAQTLDQQYEHYLAAACTNLNFARDQAFNLLPGQAGPQLTSFCNGPPPVAGGITNGASGGGAGASASRGTMEDSSVRRRRQKLRGQPSDASDEDQFDLTTGTSFDLFTSLRYQHEKQSPTEFEDGHRSDLFGITLGGDHRFGSSGLAGLAVKFDHLYGDFNTGGAFKSNTQGAIAYGSWYPSAQSFVDISIGADHLSQDIRRIVLFTRTIVFFNSSSTAVILPPTPVVGSRSGRAYEAMLNGGYDFHFGGTNIGPRLGVKQRRTIVDAYSETGATPMTLSFDEQTQTSLLSSVGIQASHALTANSGVYVAQFNADWLHEFKNDQQTFTAHFAEDLRANPTVLRFENDAPDRNMLTARVSLVAVFKQGFNAFVTAERLFGHSYLDRFGATLGVRKEF